MSAIFRDEAFALCVAAIYDHHFANSEAPSVIYVSPGAYALLLARNSIGIAIDGVPIRSRNGVSSNRPLTE